MVETPATIELDKRGIKYRVFIHPGEVLSLEQAAAERGQEPEQVVRSILFRVSAQEYLLALMPGPRQISWKLLRDFIKVNRVTMASDEEVLATTGYRPGSVTPIGLLHPLRILADQSLLDQPEVSLGSGIRGTAIILTPQELLLAIPNLEIVNLTHG